MFGKLLELLVALLVIPPLICCALQASAAIMGIVLPWLIGGAIALGVVACVSAGLATRRRIVPPVAPDDLPMRVPPVRRPRGIEHRRRDRYDD